MGAPKASALGARSLDRLKSLDSLPGITEQLRTARELCTTADRASMIIRWLLEKLSKSKAFSTSNEAWIILHSTIRLLPPQKVANHLSAYNFIDLLGVAILESTQTGQCLKEINGVVATLMAITDDLHGVAVKALFRIAGDKTAPLVGAWLERYVLNETFGLLDPKFALQFWDLRKPGTDDDDIFTKHCFRWAVKLLRYRPNSVGRSMKRARSNVEFPSSAIGGLERMLAKHVFLPARLQFYAEQGTSHLKSKLSSLTTADLDHQVLSTLLDISGNLVPVTTPKQRKDESRWVEAVFGIMASRIQSTHVRLDKGKLICSLLEVILTNKYSLSHDALSDVISDFTNLLGEDDASDIEWNVVEQVIEVDPSLFMEEPFASVLFRKLPQDSVAEDTMSSDSVHTSGTIAEPMMRCFAKYHNASLFLSHLETQAKQDYETAWLDVPFDALLEHVPIIEIGRYLHRYLDWLVSETNIAETRAGISLLCSILKIRQTDETWVQLNEHCGTILQSCIELVRSNSKIVGSSRIWELLKIVFLHWFPMQAALESTDPPSHVAMGLSILNLKDVWKASKTDKDALSFLVTVCLAFKPYTQCSRYYHDLVKEVEKRGRSELASSLVPEFIPGIEIFKQMLQSPARAENCLEYLNHMTIEQMSHLIESLMVAMECGDRHQKEVASRLIVRVPAHLQSKSQRLRIEKATKAIQNFPTADVSPLLENAETETAERVLREAPFPPHRQAVLHQYRTYIGRLKGESKLNAIIKLLELAPEHPSSALPLLVETMSTIDNQMIEDGLDREHQRYNLFMRILALSNDLSNYARYRHATNTVIFILQNKRFMVNQYSIEATLATYHSVLRQARDPMRSFLFLDVCRIFTTILQKHEHRMQGRFHLTVNLIQELITTLLIPWDKRILLAEEEQAKLKLRQAGALSQVIRFFCNPRQRVSKAAMAKLSDEARKAKSHVGEFVRYVLHHYCAEVLKNPPNEEVKRALTPGLWAIIEAIETGSQKSIESLSAAMNHSQRGIFRGLYDEWKMFGKWKPGAIEM